MSGSPPTGGRGVVTVRSAPESPGGAPFRPDDDEQALSKANEAIAIRPKRGKLTLLSRRIYNVLLYHAQQQGADQPAYTIMLGELISDARFNSNNTELLKSHIRDMQATTIEWHTSGPGRQSWISTQLLGPVRIDEPGRGQACSITWSFPEPIRDKLVRPAQYTRILLEISSQMRSYATAVLYELGARYLTSPARLTMREDLIWWASVLTGRSDITRVDYRILHRDTIRKALAELDTLAEDFRMEVVEHRRGRRVEELQFRIVPKRAREPVVPPEGGGGVLDLELVERTVALGLGRSDAHNLYASTDEAALRAAVEHVEQRLRSPTLPPLKSPAAYLRDALQRKYAAGAESVVAGHRSSARTSGSDRLEDLREAWRHYHASEARRRFEAMDAHEQEALIERFEAQRLGDLAAPIVRAWKRERTASRVAGSAFFRWMAEIAHPAEASEEELREFAPLRPWPAVEPR